MAEYTKPYHNVPLCVGKTDGGLVLARASSFGWHAVDGDKKTADGEDANT